MQPKDMARYTRLKTLAPIDAVRTWLDGAFGIGDETALIAAIRRDTRVSMSDSEIIAAMCNAISEVESDAAACLDRLAGST